MTPILTLPTVISTAPVISAPKSVIQLPQQPIPVAELNQHKPIGIVSNSAVPSPVVEHSIQSQRQMQNNAENVPVKTESAEDLIQQQRKKILELQEALQKSQQQLLEQQRMLQQHQSQLNVANNNNSGASVQKVQDNAELLVQNQQLQSQIEQLQMMQMKVQEHQAAVQKTLNGHPLTPEVVKNSIVK